MIKSETYQEPLALKSSPLGDEDSEEIIMSMANDNRSQLRFENPNLKEYIQSDHPLTLN